MKLRRLAFVFVSLPVALYLYACSSDSNNTTSDEDAGVDSGNPNPGKDSGQPGQDSGQPGQDSGTDAGADADAGPPPPTCVGNPLTADGGGVDGGAMLDAGVVRAIYTEQGLGSSFIDGPTWIDVGGGQLVFTQLYATPPELRVTGIDGGTPTVIRTAVGDQLPVGSTFYKGKILTALSTQPDKTSPAGIWQTLPDGGDGGTTIGVGASTNPNDLVVGKNGTIYFTDPQYQKTNAGANRGVYRIAPDGGVSAIETIASRVNGVGLSPDLSKLYVTLTDDQKIRSYNLNADGTVNGNGTDFAGVPTDAPDGMTVDVGGNLWVAEAKPVTGVVAPPGGRVEVFSPAGVKLGEIPFATERPTNVAFGGTDNKTLFITTEASIFVYQSRCAGVR